VHVGTASATYALQELPEGTEGISLISRRCRDAHTGPALLPRQLMSPRSAVTVFTFTCQHCGQQNEHHERHRPAVQPHLVSTRCVRCARINQLGGIAGIAAERTVDPVLEDDRAQTA